MDAEDLRHALAGLLICLGDTMSPDHARRIRSLAYGLAAEMRRNGETTRGTLLEGLADALAEQPSHPKETGH